MTSNLRAGATVVVTIVLATTIAEAQEVREPTREATDTAAPAPASEAEPATVVAPLPWSASGLEAESLPAEHAEESTIEPAPTRLGPTPVADVRVLMDVFRLRKLFGRSGIRMFGWAEGSFTGSTSGTGRLVTAPVQNRFSDVWMLNQFGVVLQRPLDQTRLSFGFNVRYFFGADAALGQPKGGIESPPKNAQFSQDFRDLFVSAHFPIRQRGLDVMIGRMNTIIGYNGFLSPYRPMLSSDYQFFYSQDGAFTGLLAKLQVNDRLDVYSGVTLGANTFFVRRAHNSFCYIGQVNYWLTAAKRTRLTFSTYIGPQALFAAPNMTGKVDTMIELRVQHNWHARFTQVVQSNMGWDAKTPVGLGSWYGVYTVGIVHIVSQFDMVGRVEWFRDVRGTRTGVDTNYGEVTIGANWHPNRYVEFRPEGRYDFAGTAAFGGGGMVSTRRQLTGVISALLKF